MTLLLTRMQLQYNYFPIIVWKERGSQYGIYLVSRKQHEIFLTHFLCSSVLVIFEKARILYNKNQNKND